MMRGLIVALTLPVVFGGCLVFPTTYRSAYRVHLPDLPKNQKVVVFMPTPVIGSPSNAQYALPDQLPKNFPSGWKTLVGQRVPTWKTRGATVTILDEPAPQFLSVLRPVAYDFRKVAALAAEKNADLMIVPFYRVEDFTKRRFDLGEGYCPDQNYSKITVAYGYFDKTGELLAWSDDLRDSPAVTQLNYLDITMSNRCLAKPRTEIQWIYVFSSFEQTDGVIR